MKPANKNQGSINSILYSKKPLNVKRFMATRFYLLRSPYIHSKKENQEDVVKQGSE